NLSITILANYAIDSLFLVNYQSVTPYNPEMVDTSDVRVIFAPVKDLEKGEVSEVINEDGRLYLLKKVDECGSEVKFVTFGIDITADPIATVDKQAKEADDFSFFAEDNGFKSEAEQRDMTIKEGFATKGNNFISGIGRSQQIMEFLS